jgi:hypothetical protein
MAADFRPKAVPCAKAVSLSVGASFFFGSFPAMVASHSAEAVR